MVSPQIKLKPPSCYTTDYRTFIVTELLFGTAGIPHSSRPQTTLAGIKRVRELGLDCMELEFVRGIYIDEEKARLVAEAASSNGISLSAHAPYFLNFNAHEVRKIRASQGMVRKAARIASMCGAESVIFHAGFYLGDPPQEVYQTIKKYLAEVVEDIKKETNRLYLRPEVSGKSSQFGTIKEILSLSTELDRVAPAIDFAHWHAHSGQFNSYPEFSSILLEIKEKLGRTALDNMHLHISGIAYGKRGELKHLNLRESDFNYLELLKALKDFKAKGLVICESPNREEDAWLLKESYQRIS